ncbi:MAG: DUF5916 domain-containing protein [Acidobacteria bacterium]|nr:DUF5916 domain-containing protein [Acidobacteriota bacterium]
MTEQQKTSVPRRPRGLVLATVLAVAAVWAAAAPVAAQSEPSSAGLALDGRASEMPEERLEGGGSAPPPGAVAGPSGGASPGPAQGAAGLGIGAGLSIKQIVAAGVEDTPVLDGDVLGDSAWAAAPPATGFRQTAPDEGQPASERTEVRIVYTSETIYVGVVCYDADPSSIIVTDSRRDSSLRDSDSFLLILDTFSDRQNGFVFGTSPAGQEYDGQVINEGGGRGGGFGSSGSGGFSRGSAGGFNLNWDGAWQVRTRVSDIGWSAEFAIPLRTVRYPARERQSWGVNFQRNIRRRNETVYWAPLPRQYNLYRVSMAGQLNGLQLPTERAANLQMTPYVIGEMVTRDAAPDRGPVLLGDAGGDLKYSVTSGLTLDATYNTDFAQVEVDDQQINLDRFNLFFPEKRPFFLENAGAFTVNAGSASGRNLGQTELFFSRRIGIDDTGAQIPISAGARLSGKVFDTVTVGFLNMQTEAPTAGGAANNFTVTRVRQDLPNRSSIGGLFVNRQATGPQALASDYNRTYAVDGRWGIGQNGLVQGFVGGTQTPGRDGRDHALSLSGTYDSQMWRLSTGYQENGEDFNPEVGYLRRPGGFRKYDLAINNTSRPNGFLKFQELRPHATFSRIWNLNGVMETTYIHTHFMGEFEDSSSVGLAYDTRSERVFQEFSVSGLTIPASRYDWSEVSSSFFYDRSAPGSAGVRAGGGGFFGGRIVPIRPTIRARYGESLNLSVSYSRNDIDLPAGTTVTNLTSVRAGYNVTPRMFFQTLVQHNDSARLWSVNFRVGWLQDANTGLFLVYNETEGIYGDREDPLEYAPAGAGRSLILKYSYLFDVLD